MPRVSPIQESFSSGEISRNVRGRVTSDVYKNGLAIARNWQPVVQGPIRLRNGSKFLAQVDPDNWVSGSTSNSGIRTFNFRRGLGTDVLIEIGEGVLVAKDAETGSGTIGGETGNLIPNAQYGGQLDQWTLDQVTVQYGADPPGVPFLTGFLGGPNAVNAGTPDAYWFYFAPGSSTPDGFQPGALQSGTAGIDIPAGSELETCTLTVRWALNTNDAALAILGGLPLTDWKWRIELGTTVGGNDVLSQDADITLNQEWVDTIINFVPGATNNKLFLSTGFVYVGADIPNGFTGLSGWMGVHRLTAPFTGGSGTEVEFVSPWDAAQLECLNYDLDPGEGVAIFTHPNVEPYRLRFFQGEWTFEALTTITQPTTYAPPVSSPWSGTNWPRACAYHEGRLYLGGTPNEPSTLWASRSGNYQDFDGTGADSKDDPLLFPLSSAGIIQTLTSRKDLVVNTDISEVIGTSVGGVIAFDDFAFPKQTDWGANCIQPIVVGRSMVYTSNSRRLMRTFADEGGTNYGWDGVELSLLAEDIFRTPVKQMAFMDEPSYQAAFLLADGTLAMATWYYPEEVIGWWRLETAYNDSAAQPTNRVMSIASVDTETGSKLWMTINRAGFPGTLLPNHELLSFDRDSIVALDTYAIRAISAAGIISDIDYLTDQNIDIVVQQTSDDGTPYWTIHPSTVNVVAGVSTPLDEWAWGGTAYVGHAYDNAFQLLPVEAGSVRGTGQVTKRRWNQIYLRLNASALPLVEGEYPRDRTPATPMGFGEPIISGDVEYSELGSGEGDLLVVQDKPLITEVTAIFGKLIGKEI